MIQISNVNPVADNRIAINGVEIGVVDDTLANQILSLVRGQISMNTPKVSTPVATPKATSSERTKYVATKPLKAKYKVEKKTSVDGKELFCISRDCGWTRAEKACLNNAIKALKDIVTIECELVKDDGSKRTFKAWGYKTKKQAEAMMATLPTEISVDELNA